MTMKRNFSIWNSITWCSEGVQESEVAGRGVKGLVISGGPMIVEAEVGKQNTSNRKRMMKRDFLIWNSITWRYKSRWVRILRGVSRGGCA